MGIARLLGGILIFAALSAPGQASSAVVTPGLSVTLAWNPTTDLAVGGYRIYYGTASGTYNKMVDAGKSTSATISGLIAGTNYFFAVTVYDLLGLESVFSSEISYTPVLASLRFRVTPTHQPILTVTGRIGHTYEIQATQTLASWTVIGTVTLGASGSLDFTDTNAASFPRRFYRTLDPRP